jgi:hypothetical protein
VLALRPCRRRTDPNGRELTILEWNLPTHTTPHRYVGVCRGKISNGSEHCAAHACPNCQRGKGSRKPVCDLCQAGELSSDNASKTKLADLPPFPLAGITLVRPVPIPIAHLVSDSVTVELADAGTTDLHQPTSSTLPGDRCSLPSWVPQREWDGVQPAAKLTLLCVGDFATHTSFQAGMQQFVTACGGAEAIVGSVTPDFNRLPPFRSRQD